MTGLSKGLRIVLPGAIALFALAVVAQGLGIVVNASRSAPLGFYRRSDPPPGRTAISNGNYVLFCPDQRWPGFKENPNYRNGWLGNCPDGFEALLKPVVAWPGDTVTVTPLGVAVNGALLLNSMATPKDSNGEVLHAYPLGNYKVNPGQLWVISSYSRRSFDSR